LASNEKELSVVRDYVTELYLGDRVMIGVKKLNSYIVERMMDHIKDKFHEMRYRLMEQLRLCKEYLNKVGRIADSPHSIVMRDYECIVTSGDNAFKSNGPGFRRLVERMGDDVNKMDVSFGPSDVRKLTKYVDDIGEDNRGLINHEFTGKRIE